MPLCGAVLGEGQRGELVLTSLTKEAMPVIRYRTRDLTRLLPGTARSLRRMERIAGRSDDMIILRGVNVFPSQIEEIVLRSSFLTGHYQIELTRDGRMDAMAVRIEAAADAWGTPALADEEANLARHIKDMIGITARVAIVAPGSIERSLGKARRVIDRREPQTG